MEQKETATGKKADWVVLQIDEERYAVAAMYDGVIMRLYTEDLDKVLVCDKASAEFVAKRMNELPYDEIEHDIHCYRRIIGNLKEQLKLLERLNLREGKFLCIDTQMQIFFAEGKLKELEEKSKTSSEVAQ